MGFRTKKFAEKASLAEAKRLRDFMNKAFNGKLEGIMATDIDMRFLSELCCGINSALSHVTDLQVFEPLYLAYGSIKDEIIKTAKDMGINYEE